MKFSEVHRCISQTSLNRSSSTSDLKIRSSCTKTWRVRAPSRKVLTFGTRNQLSSNHMKSRTNSILIQWSMKLQVRTSLSTLSLWTPHANGSTSLSMIQRLLTRRRWLITQCSRSTRTQEQWPFKTLHAIRRVARKPILCSQLSKTRETRS